MVVSGDFRVTVVLYITDPSALGDVFGSAGSSLVHIFRTFSSASIPDDVILDRFVVAVVTLDAELGTDFAWKARQDFLSNVNNDRPSSRLYDVFVFFEDDHDVTGEHLVNFLHWTACEHLPQSLLQRNHDHYAEVSVKNWSGFRQHAAIRQCHQRLPSSWIAGFLQYETVEGTTWEAVHEENMHLLNGALMHNDGYRLYTHGNDSFLVIQVRHEPSISLWTLGSPA